MRWHLTAFGALAFAAHAGCSSSSPSVTDSSDAGTVTIAGDPVDIPINGVTKDQVAIFQKGDELFDLPLHEYDGLGPLYTRPSCSACHDSAVRGPGLVQKMVVVNADGISTASDQSKLPFGHTVHPLLAAGAKTAIVPPADDPSVKVSMRVGPPVIGRGYLEAIDDAEIVRVAAAQAARPDGIHGRVNHVVYASEANPDTRFHTHQKGDIVIGRFGLKARVATLDDFTADALQGDMGITSPLRPTEFANPDGLTDDLKPGVDVDIDSVNNRAMYVRMLAIPRRVASQPSDLGPTLFDQMKCSACHVPTMHTRADYPLTILANLDAPVFTDLLLHDMGDALADGMVDGEAGARDWRTSPLIGLRFNKTFMHDGRARTIDEAILQHDGPGSEASEAIQLYRALSDSGRQALVDYVSAL